MNGPKARADVRLRPMLPTDAPGLAALFVASIEELTADDYDRGQQAAWAGTAEDTEAFGRRLASWLTLVAVVGGAPLGFASLKMPDTVEMLYVHPEAVRQGVATVLCDALEKLAQARGATAVLVQASDTAQEFFTERGYRAEQRNTVSLGGEWLGRTLMKKPLGGSPSATAPNPHA